MVKRFEELNDRMEKFQQRPGKCEKGILELKSNVAEIKSVGSLDSYRLREN